MSSRTLLSPQPRPWTARSDGSGALRIAVALAATAACGIGLSSENVGLLGKLALTLVSAYVMAGLFSVVHYCAHGSFFKTRRFNESVGRLAAMITLMNFSAYRFFHLHHHRNTAVEGDSEPSGDFRSIWHYLFAFLNWDYVVAFWRISIMSLLGYFPFFVRRMPERRQVARDGMLLCLFLVGLLTVIIFYPTVVLLSYLVPLSLALCLNFFLVLGEHLDCDGMEGQLANARTFAKQGAIFNFFHHYSNYHAAHHYAPTTAPWHIPQLHQEILPSLKHLPITYFAIHKKVVRQIFAKSPVAPGGAGDPRLEREGRVSSFFYSLEKETKCASSR